MSKYGYLEIFQIPLEFEITGVDCIYILIMQDTDSLFYAIKLTNCARNDAFLCVFLFGFQEYFTYIEPIVHQSWTKTGEHGEKPPDHP